MDLKALKSRHQELEEIVQNSYQNYMPDDRVRRFKKEKLRIKELLEKEVHAMWYKKPANAGFFISLSFIWL